MENTCVGYAAAILGNARDRAWGEDMGEAMEVDEDNIRDFFSDSRYVS